MYLYLCRYGLVVPNKNRPAQVKPGNVFGEDSSSDADDGSDWVRKALRAEGEKNLVKKQTQLTMKRALKEDPTVYQYDEVYDDIERSKVEEKIQKKTVQKKAKYIDNLLKAADRRKREQEHRVERMVQKEREAEGAMFADKESFVTSAYRAKLEEFKKMEEEEKRMDRLEAIGDVTKQQDISGFYRHLYSQTVDVDKKVSDKNDTAKGESSGNKLSTDEKSSTAVSKAATDNIDGDDPLTSDSEQNSDDKGENNSAKAEKGKESRSRGTIKRQYRKRMAEESQSNSENESENGTNLSKSLTDKEVSDKISETTDKKLRLSLNDRKGNVDNTQADVIRDSGDSKSETKVSKVKGVSERISDKPETETNTKKIEKIKVETPKISIWEKRTVGPVFEDALKRYYARKAARSSGS